MDSDIHVIETGEVYERWFLGPEREGRPQYLGMSPTNFPHWNVRDCMILPWARAEDVIEPQKALDALSDETYEPIRKRGYDAATTRDAIELEGIDCAVLYRTFAHMVSRSTT